jgi:hypothetical protein
MFKDALMFAKTNQLDLPIFHLSSKSIPSFDVDFFLPPPSLEQAWARKSRTSCVDIMQNSFYFVANFMTQLALSLLQKSVSYK